LDSALAEVREARDGPVGAVRAIAADLSDLGQAVQLAERLAALGPIHTLVHNAGALTSTYTETPSGSEQTVAVHLLAPYLLTEHLLGVLRDAAPARVVVTTSGGMYTQRHRLADLEMSAADYRGPVAYARAKRAQVVLVDEWQRRYRRSGVDFFAVHPGWADTPGLRQGMPTFARWLGPALRTPEEGADTLAWLAAGGGQPVPGRVWLDRRAPWTIVSSTAAADQGAALWAWCAERTPDRTG
jgi:NAD(P)-dependent dehydrogenase (short-subunit alcohol dehydrogenase family)